MCSQNVRDNIHWRDTHNARRATASRTTQAASSPHHELQNPEPRNTLTANLDDRKRDTKIISRCTKGRYLPRTRRWAENNRKGE